MSRLPFALAFLALPFLSPNFAQAGTTECSVAPIDALERMFADARAKAKWSIDDKALWGYFFLDKNRKNLRTLSRKLKAQGYSFVELYPSEDKTLYTLHVEKVEKHTPQTLYDRNLELCQLTGTYGVGLYDGMDVGPIKAKKNG